MRQSIAHYISNLLYLHDCVILPGFGGFVGNKKSAYIHPVSGVIYPPSKEFLFNKNLTQNDGLLATHIAKEEGIDLSKASNLIENFALNIQTELNSKSAFKLERIGVFRRGKEGTISFTQDKNYNYNLASFGMQVNHRSKKVERNITIEKEVVVKAISQKDFSKTFLRAAAVIVPLIGLSLIGITQEEKINAIYSQMANLNPFANIVETEIETEVPRIERKTPIVKNTQVEKIEFVNPIVIEQNTYFIIAGAFAEQKNAYNLLRKLKRRNYDASIIEGGNLMRVSYNSFINKEDALLALDEIRRDNKSAWLLTK